MSTTIHNCSTFSSLESSQFTHRGLWTDSDGSRYVLLAGFPSDAALQTDATKHDQKHNLLGIRIDEGFAPRQSMPDLSDTSEGLLEKKPEVKYMNVRLRAPPDCFESKWDPDTQTLTILGNEVVVASDSVVDFHSPFALTYLDDRPVKLETIERPLAQELLEYIFELYSECVGVIDRVVGKKGLQSHLVYKIPKTTQALLFSLTSNPKQRLVSSSFYLPPPWFHGRSTELLFVIANSAYPVVDLPVEQRHWRCPSQIVTIREEYLPYVRDLVRAHLFLFNLTNEDNGLVLGYDPSFDGGM